MKTILALDLGTKTGWALYKNGQITSGSQSFKTDRFDGAGMRFLRFNRWLSALKKEHAIIQEIYFEEVRRHAGTQAAHIYGGFQAALTMWCEEWLIPYESVPVGTIKLYATGKGNANKGMMMEAARRLDFNVLDDNEADAIHLLRYAIDAGNH
jgi:hypothetical protein